jgi:AAA+ ATPase superfamily predicted ATPase
MEEALFDMQFINRQRELFALQRFHEVQGAGLFILYGRRRVGKTRLLVHFTETRQLTGAFYWMATTHSAAYQLRDFSQALLRHDPRFQAAPAPDFSFADWEAALNHLADMVAAEAEPRLVILDEFTYLIRNEPALTSVFQKIWDHRLSQVEGLKLVLTGSLIGMMAREVFAAQAPLHGRATAQLRLRPLPYASLAELFGDRSPAERVTIYAVTGGVPAYIEQFTRSASFTASLRDDCLGPGSIMLADPALILHEQLQEPQTYESILSVIAGGFHQWRDVARMAGVTESSLGHYLKVLQELEFIERRDPILSKPGGRRGRYHVRDHFLRFYYRFIVPQLNQIERGYLDAAVDKVNAELPAFVGSHIFEELCREWVWAAAAAGELLWQPETVGSYWRQKQGQGVQLDVVAAAPRQKRLFIGEAKWGQGQLGRRVLTDLVDRSKRMPQVADGWQTDYGLFARGGFSQSLRDAAGEMGALLVTLSELEETLTASSV